VSEIGFTRNGIAVIPDEDAPENAGSDQAHWLGLSRNEKSMQLRAKVDKSPLKEKVITQEMRQIAFDSQETTDDHGMQIYGIAKDQNGTKYYLVKNSWGEAGNYKGIWYASETFVKYKTTSITVNKAALPKPTASKLGL
jgi:aminopeptidase C